MSDGRKVSQKDYFASRLMYSRPRADPVFSSVSLNDLSVSQGNGKHVCRTSNEADRLDRFLDVQPRLTSSVPEGRQNAALRTCLMHKASQLSICSGSDERSASGVLIRTARPFSY